MAAPCALPCDKHVRNYIIERGIQFVREVTVTAAGAAVDLTGVTMLGNVRLSRVPEDYRPTWPKNTGPIITTLDLALNAEPTTGKFTFGLTIVKTLLLVRSEYDYDIVFTFPSTDKQRIFEGIFTAVEISSHA